MTTAPAAVPRIARLPHQVLSETVPATPPPRRPPTTPTQRGPPDQPDGSFVTYGYDATATKTAEVKPLHGYSSDNSKTATTSYTYDYGNRLTLTTEPNALQTSDSYDELGRQTSARAPPIRHQTPPTTPWAGCCAKSMATASATQRLSTRTAVSQARRSAQRPRPRPTTRQNLKTQTDADSNLLTNTYDAFGNLTEAKHTNSGGTVLKDTSTTSTRSEGPPRRQTPSRPEPQLDLPGQHHRRHPGDGQYDATPLTSVRHQPQRPQHGDSLRGDDRPRHQGDPLRGRPDERVATWPTAGFK